jgi:hypothetical protein
MISRGYSGRAPDTTLNLPDFRGSEEAFNWSVVSGRASRGDSPGKSWQTLNPEHFALRAAASTITKIFKGDVSGRMPDIHLFYLAAIQFSSSSAYSGKGRRFSG